MRSKKALTYGDKPLSAAHVGERLDAVLVKFRQELDALADSMGASGVTPWSFRDFTAALRAANVGAGLDALPQGQRAETVPHRYPLDPDVRLGILQDKVCLRQQRAKRRGLTPFATRDSSACPWQ